MRPLITGATGTLGRELLVKHREAVVLSRDPSRVYGLSPSVEARSWRPDAEEAPRDAFAEVGTVFHLAGEPVAEGRWTREKKQRIRDSRVLGTRNLVATIAKLSLRPKVLVSASAVGFYGDRRDEVLDEGSEGGDGFLAEVCQAWEREAMVAEELGVRVVCVRIGVVLASKGGALEQILTPFKMGVGGRLGNGAQWMPWVHIDDVVGILLHASRHDEISGPVNAVSPHPVTNSEFTHVLANLVHRPALLAVPKAALRVAFGEVSDVLLASQRVLPRRAGDSGYSFCYPDLSGALAAAMNTPSRGAAA